MQRTFSLRRRRLALQELRQLISLISASCLRGSNYNQARAQRLDEWLSISDRRMRAARAVLLYLPAFDPCANGDCMFDNLIGQMGMNHDLGIARPALHPVLRDRDDNMVLASLPEGAGLRTPPASTSGSALFRQLWSALADLLGTAATAAIVGRALRRAQPRNPQLNSLTIERVDREFGYLLPSEFDQADGDPASFRALLEELRPLLIELTGNVALRCVGRIPELREWARLPV